MIETVNVRCKECGWRNKRRVGTGKETNPCYFCNGEVEINATDVRYPDSYRWVRCPGCKIWGEAPKWENDLLCGGCGLNFQTSSVSQSAS